MKKFAQLLPTTARADNQFINISNPDPFTLLKLISTKYVFPNHVHKFQSLSNFSASQIWWNQPPYHFGWKKNCFLQNLVVDEYTESMSIWNTEFLSHWSLPLSYLYWKIQKPTPRRKIEFLTDCCFNFQFNLRGNEYINSNAHNAPLFDWWRKNERMREMSELKSDLFELAFVIYIGMLMTCLRTEKDVRTGGGRGDNRTYNTQRESILAN